jgi:hypothetical protein
LKDYSAALHLNNIEDYFGQIDGYSLKQKGLRIFLLRVSF